MCLIRVIIPVWFTTHGRHLIISTWATGHTPGMGLSMVILMAWAIHHGTIPMVSTGTTHPGTSRTIPATTGDPTGDTVHFPAPAQDTIMAVVMPGMEPGIVVTGAVIIMAMSTLPVMIVT